MLLVSLTVVNLLLRGLRFFYLLFKSDNPASEIGGFLDLESMLMSVGFEEKLVCTFLGYDCGIALKKCESSISLDGLSRHLPD
jgi:hypothetical protein